MQAAFVFGGDYGRGFAICRNQGKWGGPAAVRFTGGSFGARIGSESTDFVMLIINRRGMERFAADKFTLGGDVSAEIPSYSRTHGAFVRDCRSGPRLNLK
jgi:lipid-binding SYLF domain-containing protein